MSALERRLHEYLRAVKMGDRQHAGQTATEAHAHAKTEKPDMLLLGGSPADQCKNCSVLVALTGHTLDHELMALACAVAEQKHAGLVHALYVIEVPRTKPVTEEMPAERAKAKEVLDEAAQEAHSCHIAVDPEFLQSRNIGQSVVAAAEAHRCSLLIIGVPYTSESGDQFELTDRVDYVLKNAPCRVWVIRGQRPDAATDTPEPAGQRQTAGTR